MFIVNQFRNAASAFAQREVVPLAADIDRSNSAPMVCQLMVNHSRTVSHLNCSISGRNSEIWAFLESPCLKHMEGWG
jgi:hypothetical protein